MQDMYCDHLLLPQRHQLCIQAPLDGSQPLVSVLALQLYIDGADLVLVHVLGHVNQLPCALGMQQLLLQGIAMELKVISDCS